MACCPTGTSMQLSLGNRSDATGACFGGSCRGFTGERAAPLCDKDLSAGGGKATGVGCCLDRGARRDMMKRSFSGAAAVILALAACGPALAQDNIAPKAQVGKLSMYWIDTEGGASTLIVSPSGESL